MYIPDKKSSACIVDARIEIDMENNLRNSGVDIIKTTGCSEVYSSIAYHPDIVMCPIDSEKIVVAPNVYEYYKNKLLKYKIEVIKGSNYLDTKYPCDISYNVALFGKYAIHNFDYTEENILREIKSKDLLKVNVKQGYSKCSICIVDDNSIITSDCGIYEEVKKYEVDALLISKGQIDLFDMNYGFIGGCSGLLDKKEMVFTGDITKHSDYENIKNFILSKGVNINILSKRKLLDLGSIIPIVT